MSDTYVWNYQMDGAFIRDRTAHLVRTADGRCVTTQCGVALDVERAEQYDPVEWGLPSERNRCGNCPWPDDADDD